MRDEEISRIFELGKLLQSILCSFDEVGNLEKKKGVVDHVRGKTRVDEFAWEVEIEFAHVRSKLYSVSGSGSWRTEYRGLSRWVVGKSGSSSDFGEAIFSRESWPWPFSLSPFIFFALFVFPFSFPESFIFVNAVDVGKRSLSKFQASFSSIQ